VNGLDPSGPMLLRRRLKNDTARSPMLGEEGRKRSPTVRKGRRAGTTPEHLHRFLCHREEACLVSFLLPRDHHVGGEEKPSVSKLREKGGGNHSVITLA